MHAWWVKFGCFMLLGFLVWASLASEGSDFSRDSLKSICLAQKVSEAPANGQKPDIQWFREEMKISPKYMEQDQGILGMSWTHFFTMVFLVLFCVAAVCAAVMRQKRTKELLNLLVREEEKGGTDS